MKRQGVPCLVREESVPSAVAHMSTPRVPWKGAVVGCGWRCPQPRRSPPEGARAAPLQLWEMLCWAKRSLGAKKSQPGLPNMQALHEISIILYTATQKALGSKLQMLLLWEVNAEYELPGSCEKELPLSASFLMNCSNSVVLSEVYFANKQ